jgi:hypothetical protein
MATQLKTVESVGKAIDEFKAKFLNELVSQKIQLTPVYRARSTRGEVVHWPDQYEVAWGRSATSGVYLHFNEDDLLLYVGKAASLGPRLACYYIHADYPRDRSCKVIDPRLEREGGSGIRVIPLDEELAFLAPALESYLIYHLDPPLNTQGRNRTIADS